MKLDRDSVAWALNAVAASSDSDLFPPTPEFKQAAGSPNGLLDALTSPELKDLEIGASMRFLVPKDDVSYRQATQLDPQDGLILTALVYQFGQRIEDRRLPRDQVFSYRFGPTEAELYTEESDWNRFWAKARDLAKQSSTILYCDITDFYNQIYHHTLENQLIASKFPNQAIKWILALMESTTAGVSRGVPIGPHAIHILAEASLIPIDNSLRDHGLRFVRFVDDILVFCDSPEHARSAIYTVARTLDRQQRLTLQRHKTRVFNRDDFYSFADSMAEDQPISELESDLLSIVRKYSHGNPYRAVQFSDITEGDWAQITTEDLTAIVEKYLSVKDPDHMRLGWFYRRLAQIGHPGALKVTLDRLDDLGPSLPSVVRYMASLYTVESSTWREVGGRLLDVLESERFREQEYFTVMLLGLFARNRSLNNFAQLGRRWPTSSPPLRRQLILAARRNGAVDWLRNLKEDFASMDASQKLAFVHAMGAFPSDERKFFLRARVGDAERTFLRALAKISKDDSS